MDRLTNNTISITRLMPGDAIVLHYPAGLWVDEGYYQNIEKELKDKLGEDIRIIHIVDGVELSILRKESAE